MKRGEKADTFVVRRGTLLTLSAVYLLAGFLVGLIYKDLETEKYIDMRELMAQQSAARAQESRSMQQLNRISNMMWKAVDNPDSADAWTELGIGYRRSGMARQALRAFDQAIQVDFKHQASRLHKGLVLLEDLKDRKGAIRAWEELLEFNPAARTPKGQRVEKLVERLRAEAR